MWHKALTQCAALPLTVTQINAIYWREPMTIFHLRLFFVLYYKVNGHLVTS